jgi:hypothetical protein
LLLRKHILILKPTPKAELEFLFRLHCSGIGRFLPLDAGKTRPDAPFVNVTTHKRLSVNNNQDVGGYRNHIGFIKKVFS